MRVFLFGVDGLTFRLLQPMMDRGLLPNFQRLRSQGVEGILRSTTPPVTPPAWTSISTGLSPARHGVYDFWKYEQTEKGPRAHVMTHREGGKAIWNMLSEWGKQVVVANIPITYPPEPVNGIMLSGYMAPDMQAGVSYPPAFKEELQRAIPGYQIDLSPAVESGQIGDNLIETLKLTRNRIALLRLLLEKPWDFFFIVFTGADRIQHTCWDKIAAFHPHAVAYYQMLDSALGMALNSLKDEDMLMVVSDHGFKRVHRQFYIQEYLHRRGLLQVKSNKTHRRVTLRTSAEAMVRKIVWSLRLRGVPTLLRRQLYRLGLLATVTEQIAAKLPALDWANTHAWLQSASGDLAGYADIYLDDSLTEQQIRDLLEDLQAIKDPETGEQLLSGIYSADAFGSGPFAPGERHLVLLSGKNITLRAELGMKNLWNTCAPYGVHHPDGVVYLYGAGVKRGVTMKPAHVYDVVPTILACMNLSTPVELEGKVMAEAFEEPLVAAGGRGESKLKQKLQKLSIE